MYFLLVPGCSMISMIWSSVSILATKHLSIHHDPSTSPSPPYPASTPPLEAKWYIGLGTNSVELSLTSWKKDSHIEIIYSQSRRFVTLWHFCDKTCNSRICKNHQKAMNFVPREIPHSRFMIQPLAATVHPVNPCKTKQKNPKGICKKFCGHQSRSNERTYRESSILICLR